jgi:crossover junction endodeoxyribonuclease RuvC
MEILLGVDPGINGAACSFVRADDSGPEEIIDVIDLPVMEDGTKNQIDVVKFSSWVRETRARIAAVENVQPMMGKGRDSAPMMGSASFRFGMVVGQIRTTLLLCGVGIQKVHPQVWKRYYELKGSDKEASRQMALRLHPEAAQWLKRKKDSDRAEAILMARWLDRQLRGANQ